MIQPDPFETALRAAGHRVTTQRRTVLQALEQAGAHVDVTRVYDVVRGMDPRISLATVYRTLALLEHAGLASRIELGSGRYEYEIAARQPHHHFVCVACGRVIEFEATCTKEIERALEERYGVHVLDTHLRVDGHCADCAAAAA